MQELDFTNRPLGPLGKVLTLYRELQKAGKLRVLSPEARQAELDETIDNAKELEKSWRANSNDFSFPR